MRISDWSSDVCSSDLIVASVYRRRPTECRIDPFQLIEDDVPRIFREHGTALLEEIVRGSCRLSLDRCEHLCRIHCAEPALVSFVLRHYLILLSSRHWRSEEHTSELQSLMRISYAVFCLNNKSTSN